MSKVYDYYKKVGSAFGPSGREDEVRETLRTLAESHMDEIVIDALGNLICHKRGNGKKIMVAAHMDSIGIVATFIDENGFIRFSPVGGLFKGDLINIQVRFANGTRGIISYEEKTPFKDLTLADLFLDIGALSKEDAEMRVRVGDFAVFEAPRFEQDDIICGPYLDNRIGCVTSILAMEQLQPTDNDLYFVFTVQEEVGLRGAGPAAFAIAPDYALAIDVTDTGDMPERKYPMSVKLGEGPAIKVMDSSVLCSPMIQEALAHAAEELAIPVQREILRFGGTDTAALQRSRGGIPSGAISIPTRYIHSPSEMCTVTDVERAAALLVRTICDTLG